MGSAAGEVNAGSAVTVDDRLQVGTVGIAYRRISPGGIDSRHSSGNSPVIVMLHEGLGSITQWRDLPEVLARRCGLEIIAYDRSGYGRSDPVPETYSDGFMEREATEMLPAVLDELGVRRPILVGHSDGASISLIAAGSGSVVPLGVAVIAPHSFIEDICIEGIRAIDGQRGQVISGLARHHDHPRLAFERWRDVWLTPRFRHWDIRPLLERIDCPVLVLQGEGDQYGTEAQVSTIVQSAPNASGHLLADCGHVAHRDQPERIADYLADFVSGCAAAAS
ncbi:alpha/beta hydrolase [Candidatus Poriferisodalis multihospitum]|uniref:alpha/beta fold hydrolase n=1 Tax=Candidatus Poriferisodalis multihospitum TaxID=2983191 RepID=UPI002B25F2A1|nr:alpha/beta hydrolase [Candidatus Poriferisodalis multihospitum]